MKKKTEFLINKAKNFLGKEVTLKGWVYNIRSSGSIVFLHVRDGSGFIQATVVKDEIKPEIFQIIEEITIETSVEINGFLKKEKRAPGGYEISVTNCKIISLAHEYPIGKKEHGPDFLLSNRHLWLRSRRQWAILRIRNQIINAINEFLQSEGYIKFDSPLVTPSACEGTTNLFDIDYFGKKAFLSQSGQLYLEAGIYSFGRCYDFGPILRAEKSKTRRHLIEFWMMDAEAAFMEFEGLLDFEEKLIINVVKSVVDNCKNELNIIERDLIPLQKIISPFIRLDYIDAIKKLNSLGSDIKYGTDLGNDDETILMTHFDKPVFITRYPADIKAFYAKKDPKNNDLALAVDLLAPEGYGEIIGGGERETDYHTLLNSIKKHKYSIEDYQWYLDLRQYGSVPHSGFGIGLERVVAWICKLDHVRESIPFPRLLERMYP
jgi:asparaginyl-tRNA synthetase